MSAGRELHHDRITDLDVVRSRRVYLNLVGINRGSDHSSSRHVPGSGDTHHRSSSDDVNRLVLGDVLLHFNSSSLNSFLDAHDDLLIIELVQYDESLRNLKPLWGFRLEIYLSGRYTATIFVWSFWNRIESSSSLALISSSWLCGIARKCVSSGGVARARA